MRPLEEVAVKIVIREHRISILIICASLISIGIVIGRFMVGAALLMPMVYAGIVGAIWVGIEVILKLDWGRKSKNGKS